MATTAQHAEAIRLALKAAGIKRRDVSVRADNYSMGSTIRVLIKNVDVSFETVSDIARRHESVRRDEELGEILGGGNRFVDISYCNRALDVVAAPIAAQISEEAGDVREVAGFRVWRENASENYYRAERIEGEREGERAIHCWSREFCARQMVQRGARLPAAAPAAVESAAVESAAVEPAAVEPVAAAVEPVAAAVVEPIPSNGADRARVSNPAVSTAAELAIELSSLTGRKITIANTAEARAVLAAAADDCNQLDATTIEYWCDEDWHVRVEFAS